MTLIRITASAASAALMVGKVYRVGLRQQRGTGGNAVLEIYLAEGSAPFGAPFASSAPQSLTSAATRVTIGATNGNAVYLTIDDLRLDAAAMPAPYHPGGHDGIGHDAINGLHRSAAVVTHQSSYTQEAPMHPDILDRYDAPRRLWRTLLILLVVLACSWVLFGQQLAAPYLDT